MRTCLVAIALIAFCNNVFCQNNLPVEFTGDLFIGKAWVIGLYSEKVVYQSKTWDYKQINRHGQILNLKLINGRATRLLSIKKLPDSSVTLTVGNTTVRLSRAPQLATLGKQPAGDIDISKPVKPDSAIYSGYIKGYSEALGYKTGNVIVHDVFTGLTDNFLINIAPDGAFATKFPLAYTKECWISLPFFNGPVCFEPGKKVFQKFDLKPQDGRWFLFMGDGALVNSELLAVKPLYRLNYTQLEKDILKLSPDQYKKYQLTYQAKAKQILDSVADKTNMSKAARQIADLDIKYEVARSLIVYNWHKENAYRRANNIPFTDRKPVRPIDTLTEAYHDFLVDIKFDSPAAVVAYDYWAFLNQARSMDLITFAADTTRWFKEKQATIAYYKKKDTLAKAEADLIDLLNRSIPPTEFYQMARPVIFNRISKQHTNFETELMLAQDICGSIEGKYQPLTDKELAAVKPKFTYPQIYTLLKAYNNKIAKEVNNAAEKKAIAERQMVTPNSKDIFGGIADKFKGKVIVVDFWATWCVPCLQNIKEAEPLKNEFKGKPVAFVYVTNHSSPENVYKIKSAGIKGEHYRISQDEWNVIATKFKIIGIPHTIIIDKTGEVDNTNKYSNANALRNKLISSLK